MKKYVVKKHSKLVQDPNYILPLLYKLYTVDAYFLVNFVQNIYSLKLYFNSTDTHRCRETMDYVALS